MIEPTLLQTLCDKSAEFDHVQLLYLFGSRVDGIIGPMSDYDFAVLFDRDVAKPALRAFLAHEFACVLKSNRVDVVILNDAPVELAYAVIAQGCLLFARNVAARIEYEAQVMGRYGDYLPVLRQQRKQITEGGNNATRNEWYRTAFRRTERTLGALKAATSQESK